jgi:HD-like signal output (HDOD) protein
MQTVPRFQPGRALLPPCFLIEEEVNAGIDPLPDVPTMLSTRLQLELLLQEPVLDLRAVSNVILQDLGATLQILRLVGEEYGVSDERPIRIEDCIASLETAMWFGAVSAMTLVQNSRAASAWQHAKQIGRYAEQLAEMEEGVRPGEGQLVGLLHEIGKLPELLGWPKVTLLQEDRGAIGAILAEHWRLPGCVLAAARELQQESTPMASRWTAILRAAHDCAQQEDARSRLDRSVSASCA